MAWPVDRTRATFNTNKHDAFAHDCVGEGAVKNGRKIPHTGIDFGGSGPIYSVYGGQVIWSGFDREAGYSIVIAETDGRFRGYCHMQAQGPAFGVNVKRGGQIGTIGATGTGAFGAHLHMWEATSAAAAIRILTGYIDLRGKRTPQQWANGMGLVDPMIRIEQSLKHNSENDKGGFLMALSDAQQKQVYDALVAKEGYYKTDAIIQNDRRAEKGLSEQIKEVKEDTGLVRKWQVAPGGYTYLAAILGIVAGLRDSSGKTAEVDEAAIASAIVEGLSDDLAKQVLDGLAERLAAK